MKRPERIEEIMKQADEGSDNISNEDWIELKGYIAEIEAENVAEK